MAVARPSKIKFVESAEEGDYECIICYTELEPNSAITQTACCLKLACTGCMMKAFYHSMMARDQVFKCPMCRDTIMEIPHEHQQPVNNYYIPEIDFADNLSSRNGSPVNIEPDEEITLAQWYLSELAQRQYHSMPFNPALTHLAAPQITESTARYTTWSHIHGITHVSFFNGAPQTVLVRFDTIDGVIRWHFPEWEIAGIWVTPFVHDADTPATQPILVIIISKLINNCTRRVVIREINLVMTVLTSSIHTTNPNLDHKTNVTFHINTNELDINFMDGSRDIHVL